MSMPPPEMPDDPTPVDLNKPQVPPAYPHAPAPPPQYGQQPGVYVQTPGQPGQAGPHRQAPGQPGQAGQQQNWAPPQQGYPYGAFGANPNAPYGYDPVSGISFSDKSRLIAGLLQIFLPFGIGRFYMGDTGIGVAQLLVAIFTCFAGSLWSFIDGILILVNGGTDAQGRPLRDGT